MPIVNPLEEIRNELHISHSQISIYINCSLRFLFQYIEGRPPERISIALPFGSAIHAGIELYYRTLKNHGRVEPIEAVWQRFEDCLSLDLDNIDVPVIWKKDLPDRSATVEMGQALLETFCEQIDLSGYEIVDVELPLIATLYNHSREPSGLNLFGVIDVILRDQNGQLLLIDHKTVSKEISQSAAEDDSQMSVYSFLVCANHLAPAKAAVRCRFDVLRKLKNPKLQQVFTVRTPFHRRRFARVANAVLAGIENRIFIPQPSWRCVDCAYSNACKAW